MDHKPFVRTDKGRLNEYIFYERQFLVYVEGVDDILFWEESFPKDIQGFKPKFKPVGGKEKLKIYESDRGRKAIIAKDSDYSVITKQAVNTACSLVDEIQEENMVVETHAYSIENILLDEYAIARIWEHPTFAARGVENGRAPN